VIRLFSVLGLAALLATAATARSMPMLDPLKLCYVSVQTAPGVYSTEKFTVRGYDFPPSSQVDLSVDGSVVYHDVSVDSQGVIAPQIVRAPVIRKGQRPFTVTAVDEDATYVLASQTTRVSALAVTVKPPRARPAQRVRFHGRGFTDTGGIYAHYLRRGDLVRTVRLARAASGACGTFTAKRRQFPFRPRRGTYLVQIDQHRRLTDDGPLVKLIIDVRRRPVVE
jgi:hypothetical protein